MLLRVGTFVIAIQEGFSFISSIGAVRTVSVISNNCLV